MVGRRTGKPLRTRLRDLAEATLGHLWLTVEPRCVLVHIRSYAGKTLVAIELGFLTVRVAAVSGSYRARTFASCAGGRQALAVIATRGTVVQLTPGADSVQTKARFALVVLGTGLALAEAIRQELAVASLGDTSAAVLTEIAVRTLVAVPVAGFIRTDIVCGLPDTLVG